MSTRLPACIVAQTAAMPKDYAQISTNSIDPHLSDRSPSALAAIPFKSSPVSSITDERYPLRLLRQRNVLASTIGR
jgi:hypothetical protein